MYWNVFCDAIEKSKCKVNRCFVFFWKQVQSHFSLIVIQFEMGFCLLTSVSCYLILLLLILLLQLMKLHTTNKATVTVATPSPPCTLFRTVYILLLFLCCCVYVYFCVASINKKKKIKLRAHDCSSCPSWLVRNDDLQAGGVFPGDWLKRLESLRPSWRVPKSQQQRLMQQPRHPLRYQL